LASGVGLTAAGGVAWWGLRAAAEHTPFVETLQRWFGASLSEAITIGNWLCRGVFSGASLADLERGLPDALRRIESRDLGEEIARRIRVEFGAGEVVSADGWVLSKTEARLYAMLALSAPLTRRALQAFHVDETVALSRPRRLESSEIGREIYNQYCNDCHDGDDANAPRLTGDDGALEAMTGDEVHRSITDGVRGTSGVMPSFKGTLDHRELRALEKYLASTARGQ
jgi:mono/diheme cytochrome c family protein